MKLNNKGLRVITRHSRELSVVSTCSNSDQVVGDDIVADDIVHTEVARDLILDLIQAQIISTIVHPTENSAVLEQLLAA